MFVEQVSFFVAFGAGLLSFFSPCILPLIPVYILYISGTTMATAEKNRKLTLMRTLGFVIGFTLVFMLMGSTASWLGRIFLTNRIWFNRLAAIFLLVFGLQMMDVVHIGFLEMEKRLDGPKKMTGWLSSILIGMAFAAGWSPCFGPILASILMLAGQSSTLWQGMLLLLVYSLGMGIPFMLTALFIDRFKGFLEKNQRIIQIMPKVGGAILILFAILLMFDRVAIIANWLM